MDLEKNITNVKNLKDQCLEQAYTIITNVYGVVPEKFNFEYTDKNGKYHIDKNITPKELYNKYIDIDLLNDYIEITSYCDEISGKKDNITLNLPADDFQSLIIKQLKSNEPVYFYCSTTSKRIDGI